MERSKQTSPLQRLLAFALSLLLVLSILPANLLTAEGAVAYTLEVNKAGNGTGDVYYSVDGGSQQKVQFSGSTGSIQLTYDEETGDLPERLDLSFEAGAYSRITAISLPDGDNTVTDDKSISYQLTDLDELFGGIEGTASCSVAFDLEQAYTVTRGTAAHVKLYVKAQDDSDLIQLPADGRVLYESQFPVWCRVESAAEYFTIQTVQIRGQEGPVTLDENGKFELNTGAFTSDHVAAIDVATEFIPTEALHLDYDESRGDGTAKILKKGATEPVTLNTGALALQPSELPAIVTITPPNNKVIVEATLNSKPIITSEAPSLTYELKKEDFLNGDAILNPLELKVTFGKSSSAHTKLIIGNSPNYDVWVKNNGGEYPTEPQTGEVPLTFPATVKVQARSEDYWVESIALNTDDGNLGDSNTAAAPYIEKVLDEATFDKYAEVQLQATMVRVYDISLAGDSSQYAQVTGSVMQNGSYSEPGTEITAGTPLTVPSGSKVKIKVTALEGHTLEGVTVNNAEPVGLTNDGTIATFVMNNVIADLPIKVTTGDLYRVELKPYDSDKGTVELLDENGNLIDTIASGSGKWLKLDQLTGAKLKFKPKPSGDETVVVSDVEIGGGQERANNKTSGEVFSEKTLDQYSFTDNKLVVTVAFKTLYTVKVEINPDEETGDLHGTAKINNAEGDYTALDGEEITVTAIPNSGYLVFSIKGYDDQNLNYNPDDNGGQYVKITVTGDLTVKVEFQPRANLSGIWFERNGERITAFNQFNSPALQVFVFGPSTSPVELKTYVGPFPFTVFHNNFNYDSFWHDYIHSYNSQWESISESKQITWLSYCIGEYTYSYFENLWYDVPSPSNSDSAEQNMYVIIDNTSPTVEIDETEYCSHYLMSAPDIEFTVTDGPDPVTSNAPEAATHAFSGIKTAYYYIGEYNESLGVTSPGVSEIYSYNYGGFGRRTYSYPPVELEADGEYKVTFVAEDFAGNKGHKTITVRINSTLNLVFDDYEPSTVVDDKPCYQEYRYATITVVDAEGFDENGISFGGNWPNAEYCSSWSNGENGVHTRRICFKDGQYNLSKLTYTGTTITAEIEPGDKFIVDKEKPTASLELDEGNSWNSPITGQPTFSVWKTGAVTLTANPADTGSGVKHTHYYIQYFTDETGETDGSFLTKEVLDDFYAQGQWTLYESGIPVAANKRCVVYLRVEDKVNNYIYINTNGIITDVKNPAATFTLPSTSLSHGKALYGIDDNDDGIADQYVNVSVSIADDDVRSGLKTIEKWITTENLTDTEAAARNDWIPLISFEPGADPAYANLASSYNTEISVNKEQFNACSVNVYVKVTDNVGHCIVQHTGFDIDYSAPEIAISFEKSENKTDPLIAWITYTERDAHFNTDDAIGDLEVKGCKNGQGWTELTIPEDDFEWKNYSNTDDLDDDTHVLKITLRENYKYQITANYTDLAGNEAEAVIAGCTYDTENPTGEIHVGQDKWWELLTVLTFGLWSNKDEVLVTVENVEDNISASDMVSVGYWLYEFTDSTGESDKLKTRADLEGYDGWIKYTKPISVTEDKRFIVYVRLADEEGNYDFISSNGIIRDKQGPKVTFTLPNTDFVSEDGITKLYGREEGENGLPVETVDVKVHVVDNEVRSGIRSISYLISTKYMDKETVLAANGWSDPVNLAPGEDPAYGDLVPSHEMTISVNKEEFNACKVYVYVKADDNAGNLTVAHTLMDIDYTSPTIDIKLETPNSPVEGYYTSVTAKVTITERPQHFVGDWATNRIQIVGTDGSGKNLDELDYVISDWISQNPDDDKHTATIRFNTDANYELTVDFTDRAGNDATTCKEGFTKDATAPDAMLGIESLTDQTWKNEIIDQNRLTYALFKNDSVEVSHTASDVTSPLLSVDYFVTDKETPYTEDGLSDPNNVSPDKWKSVGEDQFASGGYTVNPDMRAIVYLRVTDMAGNVRYVSTNGFILDKTDPQIRTLAPVNEQEYYNADVPIKVEVIDPIAENSEPDGGAGCYSGIKEIRYEVKNMGEKTQEGSFKPDGNIAAEQKDLCQSWAEKEIVVKADWNNSNDVEVIVYVTDNAGNETSKSIKLKIDVKAPEIEVSFDNNRQQNGTYFNAPRTATITITERNFNPADVKIQVSTVGGAQPVLSGWDTKEDNQVENGDNDKHTATLTFKEDGDYTFNISFTDMAGNENQPVVYAQGTVAQNAFTIDKTAPVITVKTDEAAQNGKYYKNNRVDTITITEHNFDPKTVVIDVEVTGGGAQPVLSAWTHNGDTHTATLTYSADGNYTVKVISNTDLAGNKTNYTDLASKPFTVDHTAPKITVSYDNNNVLNKRYFKNSRTATITVTETNFDENSITVNVKTNNGTHPALSTWTHNGDTHTATIVFSVDGEYELEVNGTDLAGNENDKVSYVGEAPQAFTVDQTPPEVKFTGVNHKSANNDEGNIGFTMTATDTNFDIFAPKLVVYYLEDGKFKEKEIDLSGFISDIENGKVLNVENLEEDGVYFLTCTVTDKAGNSFVQFERSDGSMATVEDAMRADGALLAFSANRKGSTFYADKNTIELFKQYYVGEVGNKVVIYEINPDALTSHTVFLNDKELSSGYTVTDLTENGADSERPQSWYKYSYEIDPALFAEEGLYTLVISSEDNAGGTAYSDRKGIRPDNGEGVFSAQFVVDRTQPVVTVSGLEDNGRYQTDRQTVTLIPADDGGQIASLHVLIKDETGKVIDELWLDENGEPLTEEKLRELLDENGGVLTFTLNESPDQYYVYIECTDTAGNKTELEFKEVTVSTSAFRIFWANKPLRWGTIGGAGGAGALAFFLLLAKKRKKKEEEVVPEKKA